MTRARHLALLGCLVLVVAGCTSADGADGDPSVEATPPTEVASAEPSVAAPPPYVPPSAAPSLPGVDTEDVDTARDFVLAYVETLNYGYATGDADPLRQVTSLSCFTCQQWIIEIATLEEEGLTREGGSVLVNTIGTVGETTTGGFQFRVVLDRLPGEVTDGEGDSIAFDASTEIVDVAVSLQTSGITGDTTWTMSSVTPPAV